MRRLSGLLLLLICLTTSACWDRLEVNDLGIISLAGVDAHPEGLRLTVRVVNPSASKGGLDASNPSDVAVIYSAEGATISDVMKRIQTKMSRRVFWGHIRALVISEEYARQGIYPILDFWRRHREPRPLMRIAVTPGSAEEFLGTRPRLERHLSEALQETLMMGLQTDIDIQGFLLALSDEGTHPVAPVVMTAPSQGDGEDIQLSGTALFRGDRMVGTLDPIETRGLLWLRGEIENGVITTSLPGGGHVSVETLTPDTILRPYLRNGRIHMVMHAKADTDLFESTIPLDPEDEAVVRVMEKRLSEEVSDRIARALGKLQSHYGVDAAGFGGAVRRTLPMQWEKTLKYKWDDLFPEVAVTVNVDIRVRRPGEYGKGPVGKGGDH